MTAVLSAELAAFTDELFPQLAAITFDPADPVSIATALRRCRTALAIAAYLRQHDRAVEDVARLLHDQLTDRLLTHGDAAGMSQFELFALRCTVLWFLP